MRLEPGSPLSGSAAAAALWADRPADAATILEHLNPQTDLGWTPTPDHFDYWSDLTEAYHMMGRHDAELAAANRSTSRPTLARAWLRGRALAALGRSADALREIDSAFMRPSQPEISLGLAPNTDGRNEYIGTAGEVSLWIARELTVHGDSADGREAAIRAVRWFQSRPPEEQQTVEVRLLEAWALEHAGEYQEAAGLVGGLVADDSANVDFRGTMAGLDATVGDTASADRLDAWLAALPPRRAAWGGSFYRARIASLLGRPDRAATLLRESIVRGAWPMWIHLDPGLSRLPREPDYAALRAPGS